MPFPPITKDSNFDYESALNEHVRDLAPTHIDTTLTGYQRSLEANLSTMNDSIDLLRSEVAKEEALLASEKKALQEMDKNAKRAEAERKRQMKNVRKAFQIKSTSSLTIYYRSTLFSGSWTTREKPQMVNPPNLH